MRLKICFFFILMTSNLSVAQIRIFSDPSGITNNYDEAKDKSKIIFGGVSDTASGIKKLMESCENYESYEVIGENDTINYKITCENEKKVALWYNSIIERPVELHWCGESFKDKPCRESENEPESENTTESLKYSAIYQIPFPIFDDIGRNDNFPLINRNRYLIVDAHPSPFYKRNNSLYKLKPKDNNGVNEFKKASAIPAHGSLAVFIKNYNFSNLKNLSVTVNGEDYSYDKDINYLLDQLKSISQDSSGKSNTDGSIQASGKKDEQTDFKEEKIDTLQIYLDSVYTYLSAIDFMNINDYYLLAAYKNSLKDIYDVSKKTISNGNQIRLSRILSYQPTYYSLTPIAVTAPDADEVDISVSIQKENENKATVHKVGKYRVGSGVSYDVGGMIYLTKLKSQEVFTDSVNVDEKKILTAQINEEDPWAIGIGLNCEMGFRTGTILVPTLNLGVFVPLDDETNTSFTTGIGLSLPTKKVKFSFSGGFAFGKIATIKERFRNNYDLSQVQNLTNESISENVIRGRIYLGLGVRFNLKSN